MKIDSGLLVKNRWNILDVPVKFKKVSNQIMACPYWDLSNDFQIFEIGSAEKTSANSHILGQFDSIHIYIFQYGHQTI